METLFSNFRIIILNYGFSLKRALQPYAAEKRRTKTKNIFSFLFNQRLKGHRCKIGIQFRRDDVT